MNIEKIKKIISLTKDENDFSLVINKFSEMNFILNKISIDDLIVSESKLFVIRTTFTENNFIILEKEKNKFFIDGKEWCIDKINEIEYIDIYEIKDKKMNKTISSDFLSESIIYFFVSFSVNIFLFSLSLIINYYIKIVFDKLIPSQNIKIILLISLVFLIINIFKIISNILLNIYEIKRTNHISSKVYEKILIYNYYINNKNFISDSNYINIYIKKYIFDRPDFYSSIFINIVIFVISFCINYFLSIIVLFSIIISLVISYFKFKINSFYYTKSIDIQNQLSKKMISFNSFCDTEKNYKKFLHYKNNIMSDFNKNLINNERYKIHEYKILLISESLSKIVYYSSVIVISYLIIMKTSLTLSVLLIFLGILEIANINSNIIFSFLSTYKEYSTSKKIYDKIMLSNIDISKSRLIPKKIICKNIKLTSHNKVYTFEEMIFKNDTIIYGENGIGKTTLFKSIFNEENRKLNNVFLNDFIYQNSKCNLDLINWSDLMSNKNFGLFLELMKKYNIKNFNCLSHGEQQILNYISLIFEKKKIILLDESLSNVDDKNRKSLLKDIKPLIEKENFLIMISHNKNDINFFKNKENLNERI